MADFCKQCTAKFLGAGLGSDFAGDITEEEERNNICVSVLCEGCGPIRVDREGNCLELDCDEDGHSILHRQWVTAKTGRTENRVVSFKVDPSSLPEADNDSD